MIELFIAIVTCNNFFIGKFIRIPIRVTIQYGFYLSLCSFTVVVAKIIKYALLWSWNIFVKKITSLSSLLKMFI